MLLSGKTCALSILLATSSLILNSLATPLAKKEQDHYVAPIAFYDHHAIEKRLSEKCNKHFDKDGKLLPVIKDCDGELVLDEGVGTASGILGSRLATGDFGSVYYLESGYWPPDHPDRPDRPDRPKRLAIAKWLKYTKQGARELENTLSLGEGEYIDFGVDKRRPYPGLWIILPYKEGRHIEYLDSYIKTVRNRVDIGECKRYMKKKRDAIIDESMKYIKMGGGPRHDDLHQDNVLFDEKSEEARLIDWGIVYWTYPDGHEPNESEAEKIRKELEAYLEKGKVWKKTKDWPKYHDFSDDNNCFEQKKQGGNSSIPHIP